MDVKIIEPRPVQIFTDSPPVFPTDAAFQHGFELFGEIYNGIDWICPAYNFAVALAHVSMALGRKYVTDVLGTLYPNFYQMIIGRTHLAAKSPTMERAVEGVYHLKQIDPPEIINVIDQINSVESFRQEFGTHEDGDSDKPMDWFTEGNGVRGFLYFDEVGTLLSKTRQRATEGISVELTRLYSPGSTPIVNKAVASKCYGDDWCLNIFGCSTLDWYEKFITQGDFFSGFLNRYVFYLHEQQEVKSIFDPIDLEKLKVWQNVIKSLTVHSLQPINPIRYKLDDAAFESYDAWHQQVYKMLIESPDNIKLNAVARVVSHAVKLSLVYAVMDNAEGDVQIHLKHFESARAVAEYWAQCAGLTLDKIAFDRRSKAEEIVLNTIKRLLQNDGDSCLRRDVRRAINYKTMSSDEMTRALEALVNAELVEYYVPDGAGSPRLFLIGTGEEVNTETEIK